MAGLAVHQPTFAILAVQAGVPRASWTISLATADHLVLLVDPDLAPSHGYTAASTALDLWCN